MAGKPLWRRAYDAVERPVGSRLEEAVQTDVFADVAGLLMWTRAEAGRRVERTTRSVLHRVNLPTASDVVRLREQVSALDRSVKRLDDSLRRSAAQAAAGGEDRGTDDRTGRAAGARAPRRRAQPAAGAQRREVRGRDRPAAGRDDA